METEYKFALTTGFCSIFPPFTPQSQGGESFRGMRDARTRISTFVHLLFTPPSPTRTFDLSSCFPACILRCFSVSFCSSVSNADPLSADSVCIITTQIQPRFPFSLPLPASPSRTCLFCLLFDYSY
uniref:Expressed protein n=1 Tax=Echinococcus granulosus TaxID=6210 RepID=A0A068WH08_ECHGR|nr:expressed protein [Echinococcus granulosus]